MGQEHKRQSKTLDGSSQVSNVVIPILLLGDKNAGKTSIIRRFVNDTFEETISDADESPCACQRKRVAVKNKPQTLEIFDEAGGESYDREALHTVIKNVEAFVIVYSVDSESSFEKAQQKYNLLVTVTEGTSAPIILVANKVDLDKSKWKVTSEQGNEMAARLPQGEYIEVSAKSGHNIVKLFEDVGALVMVQRDPTVTTLKVSKD